jgi:predicted nucleic acid-binding Zn ribbon protein
VAANVQRQPERVGNMLEALLRRIDPGGCFNLVRLIKTWPEVVGEAVARRTEVKALKFHTAIIKVSNAMWIQELTALRHAILTRLREKLADDSVRDLRFVPGRLSRRAPKPRPRLRELRRAIVGLELKDPELRAIFERLIEAWGRACH